jgi:hypothetical protein
MFETNAMSVGSPFAAPATPQGFRRETTVDFSFNMFILTGMGWHGF